MIEGNKTLISDSIRKIMVSMILVIMISIIGVFESAVLRKIIGVYQLASIIVILIIVLYLLVPLTINNYFDLIIASIIISLTIIFVYIHNTILWSPSFSNLSITVLPLFVIVKMSFGSSVIRPVLEVDWGQIVIMLVLLKTWISILKYLRRLKF